VYKILSNLVDECRRYSKLKQTHYTAWLKRPIFGVHHSQGSAETILRRGGITNYRLIAYSFNNTSAKNYQNRLICIEVTVCNFSVVFFSDTVYIKSRTRPTEWIGRVSYIRISLCYFCFRWKTVSLVQASMQHWMHHVTVSLQRSKITLQNNCINNTLITQPTLSFYLWLKM